VHLEDLHAPVAVGAVDDDLAIEAAGPQKRGVEDVGTVVSARSVNGGHLKLELDLGQHSALGGFAFEKGPMASEIVGRSATVVGDLRWDTFRGGGAVELFVEEILS
jgi:single-stranded-DNA-specific exonuclease